MTTLATLAFGVLLALVSTQTHGQLSGLGDWLGCIAFILIFSAIGKACSHR